jgi:LPXTG-site transpeptidase (sortase) family protein
VFVRTPYVPPGREPYRMVIDSIGVNAPVVAEYVDANGVPQVPHNGYDVAWYGFTAAPGSGDNAVFAAHVTWNGVAVFYNLHLLSVGSQITLLGDDGTTLLYTVTDTFLVNADDPKAVQVMSPTGYDSITLISCDGAFFNDGAFGDYTSRRVIRGALAEKHLASGTQPATGP